MKHLLKIAYVLEVDVLAFFKEVYDNKYLLELLHRFTENYWILLVSWTILSLQNRQSF